MKIDSVNHALASFEGGESAADALKRSPGGAESAFESMLLKKMVSSMRKTVPESGLWSGVTGQQMYDHFIEQALSDHLHQTTVVSVSLSSSKRGESGTTSAAEEFSDERLMRQNFDLYASKSHTKEEPEDVFDERMTATSSDTIDHDGPRPLGDASASA